MKALVVSFRRGKKNYKPRHFIIEVSGIDKLDKARELIGKRVSWESPAGKKIIGKVTSTHGNRGKLRAVFEKGLPGQAINTEVVIE
ncbi:MAG: 50S ribosomal protein L35ae [Candidatus Pacearchaeota archaeon]